MNVRHNVTSPYHPQSNGQVERWNQTLQNSLRKRINQQQNNWDEFLDEILFAYRTSIQDSSKYSPFYLMYGREPRLPIDLENLQMTSTENSTTFEDNLNLVLNSREDALININNAKQKQ